MTFPHTTHQLKKTMNTNYVCAHEKRDLWSMMLADDRAAD